MSLGHHSRGKCYTHTYWPMSHKFIEAMRSELDSKKGNEKKSEAMIPAPAEAERNIRNAVEGEGKNSKNKRVSRISLTKGMQVDKIIKKL